jgi:hypothetical protein
LIPGLVGATVLLAGTLCGCQAAPSGRPTELSPPAVLESPVAGSLPSEMQTGDGTLRALLPDQLLLVRVTAADASRTVLDHEKHTGWPDLDIPWRDGGCVFVAWYVRRPMSMAPNPPSPSPVYLVRLVGEVDASKETWVLVDATTGELGAAFSGPSSPSCP